MSSTPTVVIPSSEVLTSQDDTTTPPLEKQDRKRLKKLRKRATLVISDGEKSGLLTRVEWLEFQKLAATGNSDVNGALTSVGPSLTRRQRKEANKVEGSHHRDLVAWLMDRIQNPNEGLQSKKRARNNDQGDENALENPSIPSWASIHNPATIESLVILEVQVTSSSAEQSQLAKCQSIVDAAVAECRGRTALHLPTKWFQGYVPKATTDSLLYAVASSKPNKRTKAEMEKAPSQIQLMQDLEEMIMPLESWSSEGYPVRVDNQPESAKNECPALADNPLKDLDSIPIDEAKKFVAAWGFRVERQNENDTQLYVATRSEDTNGGEVRCFGLDCEMVLTSAGSELARITLVQLNSFINDKVETTTVLDALVKPENPVKDYLTRHSGITAELLEPVTTRLEQVQMALWQFLRPNDILVGHSLENDLIAVRYIHPRVIDTALIFRHRNKRTKFSLRHISATLLKKTIQRGSHCSKEDAEAALELAIRRAWLGDTYALPNSDERRSILEKWNADKEMKTACIGPAAWLQTHLTTHANGAHAINCDSIPECKKALLAWAKAGPRKARLTWCQIDIDAKNSFEDFQQMTVELLLQISPTAMVLVAYQEGLDNARRGYKAKRACQDPRSSVGWDAEREATWQAILESCRQGLASWIGSSNVLAA